MGQRVNIQYSVEIEDLEGEVDRLLAESNTEIEKLCTPPPSGCGTLSLAMGEHVDALRRQLAQIDYRLNDIHVIINGYLAYKTGLLHQEEVPLSSDDVEDKIMEEIEERIKASQSPIPTVEETIEEFRKSNTAE